MKIRISFIEDGFVETEVTLNSFEDAEAELGRLQRYYEKKRKGEDQILTDN